MKLSYAITVCNESKDLYGLISFLLKVKDQEDEINVLLDSLHATKPVRDVLKYFQKDLVVSERDFDGNFAEHRNYHLTKCTGDYIFIIDPHESVIGTDKKVMLQADPSIAVWHIKSVDKQDNRWNSDGTFIVPDGENFYDSLM